MKYAHLPHLELSDHYQFITFRTAHSTDDFLLALEAQNKSNRERQMAMDEYLDVSQQGAYLNGDVLQFLFELMQSKDGDLYELICFAIMPNHVHVVYRYIRNNPLKMKNSATEVVQNTHHPCALESAPPNAMRFYGIYDA